MTSSQAGAPPWPWPHDDVEHLYGDVCLLCCGRLRDAIRVPRKVGVTAYAFLRWADRNRVGAPVGGVIYDGRGRQVYFLTPVLDGSCRVAAERVLEAVPGGKIVGANAGVVLPGPLRRRSRWLNGDMWKLTEAGDVVAAIRIAVRRHATGERLGAAALSESARALSHLRG